MKLNPPAAKGDMNCGESLWLCWFRQDWHQYDGSHLPQQIVFELNGAGRI